MKLDERKRLFCSSIDLLCSHGFMRSCHKNLLHQTNKMIHVQECKDLRVEYEQRSKDKLVNKQRQFVCGRARKVLEIGQSKGNQFSGAYKLVESQRRLGWKGLLRFRVILLCLDPKLLGQGPKSKKRHVEIDFVQLQRLYRAKRLALCLHNFQ